MKMRGIKKLNTTEQAVMFYFFDNRFVDETWFWKATAFYFSFRRLPRFPAGGGGNSGCRFRNRRRASRSAASLSTTSHPLPGPMRFNSARIAFQAVRLQRSS
jgi:hypothetical protein